MEQVLVVFSSATSAAGMKKYLMRKHGIQAKMRQTPANISTGGCSYGLMVKRADAETVRRVAIENNLNIKGIFKEDGTRL